MTILKKVRLTPSKCAAQGATSKKSSTPAWSIIFAVLLFLQLTKGIAFIPKVLGYDAIFLASWLMILVNSSRIWKKLKSERFLVGAILILIASLTLSAAVNTVEITSLFEVLNYFSIFVLVFSLATSHPGLLQQILIAAVFFHAVVAMAEIFTGNSFYYSTWKNAESIYVGSLPRASSTIGDPNYLSFALISLTASLSVLQHTALRPRLSRVAQWTALFVIPFTFSRVGAIAGVTTAVGQLMRSKRQSLVALLTALTITTLLSLRILSSGALESFTQNSIDRLRGLVAGDASVFSRQLVQEFGLQTSIDNWFLGVGPGQFEKLSVVLLDPSRPLNLQTQVLNTYLEVALAAGIFGLLAFVAILFRILWSSRNLGAAVFLGFASLFVVMTTLDTLQSPFLWLAIGTWFGYQHTSKADKT